MKIFNIDPLDSIYWLAVNDKKTVNLKNVMRVSWKNADDENKIEVTLFTPLGTELVFRGVDATTIVERLSLISDANFMAKYRREALKGMLEGPKRKAGRPKAYRDSDGNLQNVSETTRKTINHWDQGATIKEIDAAINRKTRSPKTKTFDQGQIRRTLRRNKDLLLRPYNKE